MTSPLAEYSWQSMRMCAAVCASPHSQNGVSASPIMSMCSFNLLLPVITLIHVVSCDLVLTSEFSLLAGTDGHMVWSGLLLLGRLQARCNFFMIDFLILFFTMEMDVGLSPSSMASAATPLAYPSANSFAARPACPGSQWILVTILLAMALILAMHWSMLSLIFYLVEPFFSLFLDLFDPSYLQNLRSNLGSNIHPRSNWVHFFVVICLTTKNLLKY